MSIGATIRGVQYRTNPIAFGEEYLRLRDLERRVLSDELVVKLPNLPVDHPHASEWKKRWPTLERFRGWITEHEEQQHWLELGCGNGWFSNWIHQQSGARVTGVDLNIDELEQAARCFPELTWVHADIFQAAFPAAPFDVIVLNAAVQYFERLEELLERLQSLIIPGGSIHLLDSAFYTNEEAKAAHERSKAYYEKMGCPTMINHYHHRTWDELASWKHTVHYTPRKASLFSRLLGKAESPFPWIEVHV